MMEIDPAAIFDAAPTPLALISPDLTLVAVNRAYEQLMGCTRQEITGRDALEVLEAFHGGSTGETVQAVRHSMEWVMAEKQSDFLPVRRYDVADPARPGALQERYWNITHAPLLDEKGTVIGILAHVQDATALVRQQRELQGAPPPDGSFLTHTAAIEAHLEAQAGRVYEINQLLHQTHIQDQQALEVLRGAVQQQREALTDASHDLRGPLTGLLTRLQDALDDPDADPRQVLGAALHDAERLSDIVSDLLELARLEAGVPVPTEPVNLARLVRGELSRLTPEITTATRLDPGIVVDGSPVRLARLVANLLANAQRHARSRLEVTVGADGDHAVLEVSDDGPGIPDEDKEAVFRRFYRRADARRSDPGGTGLGLPISRQIAQTHGGTLHVSDRPDDSPGARFVLRLPLSGADGDR
ncbi:hypothetical protein GCM10009550_65320 [Actinocorallia libanotica]|uniref:Sensor-like histidine kinase SenX3 n=2 Tax=Actinocorallia libanotica TaxID=46162 RepID=A0ABN1RVN1_9ACTN